ncbi:MAG: hypothetical protein ACYC1Z_14475, partial [Georgenia sp.]
RQDGADGTPSPASGAAVVPLGLTSVRCAGRPWDVADVRHWTPYRDGVHAGWDAEALGGLPVYVVTPDGPPALVPPKDSTFPAPAATGAPTAEDVCEAVAQLHDYIVVDGDHSPGTVYRSPDRAACLRVAAYLLALAAPPP